LIGRAPFGLSDRVPDARTIWLFREKLTKAGAIGPLFERFDATLRQSGYIAMSGQIVDASLIAAPRQRNTQDEKKAIKDGRIPDDWKDKPAKLRQKDRDARWTVKYTKAKPREDGSMPRALERRRCVWALDYDHIIVLALEAGPGKVSSAGAQQPAVNLVALEMHRGAGLVLDPYLDARRLCEVIKKPSLAHARQAV